MADPHFGHSNIIKYCYRPFLADADREELARRGGKWHNGIWKDKNLPQWRISHEATELMDATIIDNINSMVGPNDCLWLLGDFCYGIRVGYYDRCRGYRNRIRCYNVQMIWGNHDRKQIADLFSSSADMATVVINGVKIHLCHYAMAIWDQSHRGSWHLYGHSHGDAEAWLDIAIPHRRSTDVGVDVAYRRFGAFRPFTFDEVYTIIESRPKFSPRTSGEISL